MFSVAEGDESRLSKILEVCLRDIWEDSNDPFAELRGAKLEAS
jgi:hypothetical protein